MQPGTIERSGPAQATPFHLPADQQAWQSFLICIVGGGLAADGLNRPDAATLWLLFAMAALFLTSEWISNLFGRSRSGVIDPASLSDLRGLALGGLMLASGAAFLAQLGPPERQAWVVLLTAILASIGLLFLLRQEWVPLDRRLLALTHLLLTLPCLLIAFRAWGVGSPEALRLWALPALYFPSLALISQSWMEGSSSPRSSLTFALLPLLAAAVFEADSQSWICVLLLSLWAGRAAWLLLTRRGASQGLPPFTRIQRFAWESQAWTLAITTAWLFEAMRQT